MRVIYIEDETYVTELVLTEPGQSVTICGNGMVNVVNPPSQHPVKLTYQPSYGLGLLLQ